MHFDDIMDIVVLGSYAVFFVLAWFGQINGAQFIIGAGITTTIGVGAEYLVEYLDMREGD